MRRPLALAVLTGCGLALGGCAVADALGYAGPCPYAYGYGYAYRGYGPPPGRYYYAPRYRAYDGYYRRPYGWW